MNNRLSFFATVVIIFAVGFGCSFIGGQDKETSAPANGSNKSLTDKAIDTTVGKSNIGVPECDEVMDAIEVELNNPDDNFVVKAAKATFLNRIKDGIRESVEQNPNDKVELAKTCREFKKQFDTYKAQEQDGKSQ